MKIITGLLLSLTAAACFAAPVADVYRVRINTTMFECKRLDLVANVRDVNESTFLFSQCVAKPTPEQVKK